VDTGIGMTAEQTRLAVRPFRQADGRLARDYNGLGLGLSIVSKLVERQGGRLTIASTPRQGTHVSVDFPVPRPQEKMGLLLYSRPLGTGSTRAVDAFLTEPRVAKA
jgi:signal transduction histidine kinase